MMKRTVSIILALMLVLSLSIPAFAKVETAKNVRITSSTKTINVGRTLQLEEVVSPKDLVYDDVEWISSNYDIADVDDMGEVEGISGGTATITCRIYGKDDNGKRVRLGSGQIEIKVIGKTTDGSYYTKSMDEDESSSSKSPSLSSTSSTKSKTTSSTAAVEKISSSAVVKAVSDAAVAGATTSATFKNVGSISASALQAAASQMKGYGGTVLLNFDTLVANSNSVEGRITINPIAAGNVKSDIKLGVYTNDGKTAKTRAKFEKYFKNKVVLMKADHSGNYGMNVTYAVKIGTELSKSKNLKLYSYNPSTNYYYEIQNSNIWIDTKGYVHFTTSLGDYLIVSDGALTLK